MVFFRTFAGRLLLLSLLGLAPFAGLEMYYLNQIRVQVAGGAHDQAITLAKAVALQHRALQEAATLALEQIALMDPIRFGEPASCAVRLQEIRQSTPLFVNLARGYEDQSVDCSGRVGQTKFIPAAMPAVRETLETGQVAIAPATISPNHGKPIIPLSRRLAPGPDGRPRILVAGTSLLWLDTIIGDLAIGSGAIVLVLDQNDTILASYPSVPVLIGTPLKPPPGQATSQTGRGDFHHFVTELADNQRRQVYAASFEGGIRVAVGIEESHVVANIDRSLIRHASGFAVTVLGPLLLIGTSITIIFRRRYRRFADAARRIAEGDFSARIPIPAMDTVEFSRFAAAFNSMAAMIGHRDQILLATNAALETQERQLSAMVELAVDAIFTTDASGAIRTVNGAAISLFGYDADEFRTMQLRDLVELEEGQTLPDVGHRQEVLARSKSGQYFPAILALDVFVAHDERAMVAFIHDISVHKQREEALQLARDAADRANIAKSEFLSGMSHELRTPLNIVLGYAQLLEMMGSHIPVKAQGYIKNIQSGAKILLRLIDEVLDLAKIESGNVRLSLSMMALNDIVNDIIINMEPLADEANITLRAELHPDNPCVMADSGRLSQVIMNLASNAIKYNRTGGAVTIRVVLDTPEMARILVVDTGVGIPLEQQDKVFQPFNRLGAEKGSVTGTGIGLTICKKLIEKMQGTIGFTSVVDQGSRFWITLPVAREAAVTRPAFARVAPDALKLAYAGGYTLLYVEDNHDNITLVANIISTLPEVCLLTATTARQGEEIARKERPDVIVLDIDLPDTDGYDLLARLQADPQTHVIPVLALTAAAMPADMARGVAAGFFRYLTKPVIVEDFLMAVGQALRHKSQEIVETCAAAE